MAHQRSPKGRLLQDIISWDVYNWSRALSYWELHGEVNRPGQECLELGSRRGGLSLWLALKGHSALCTDLHLPTEEAAEVHRHYPAARSIRYDKLDAANIPYENAFDIVVFKSTLGGVSAHNNALKRQTMDSIYRALKPGGRLLFAENLEGAWLHRFMRKRFVQWGRDWNYLRYNELATLFSSYASVTYETVGFFGAFGRSEKQRAWLGRIDRLVEKLIPPAKRSIVIGVAKKQAAS